MHDVAQHAVGRLDRDHRGPVGLRRAVAHHTGRVDVALHEVSAESVGQAQRTLEVYGVAGGEITEIRAGEHLDDRVGRERAFVEFRDREAAPVDRDRRAEHGVVEHRTRVDHEARTAFVRRHPAHPALLFDDAGEHQLLVSLRS